MRPDHLEPVTRAENVRRGRSQEAIVEARSRITHCPQGHEYTPDNIRASKTRRRGCKKCHRDRARARKASLCQ